MLEASTDGRTWTTLREHTNDASLARKGQTASWPIAAPTGTGFSFYRVRMTGPNSNRRDSLALSGFEIYGAIEPPP